MLIHRRRKSIISSHASEFSHSFIIIVIIILFLGAQTLAM